MRKKADAIRRSPHYRIHHKINWHHCAPKILREKWRKPQKDNGGTRGRRD